MEKLLRDCDCELGELGYSELMLKSQSSPLSISHTLASFFRARFRLWLSRRLKPARRQQLHRNNLFIFPSTAGFAYLLVNLVLWLTGTNYENNLILALAFLQTALFVVSIHHTFFNMSGLTIEALTTTPCFLGEKSEVELRLTRGNSVSKESVQLGYSSKELAEVDLIEHSTSKVTLFVTGLHRGWCRPDRLLVQSVFPLGLVRCWTWLALDISILVYPRPQAGAEAPFGVSSDGEGGGVSDAGVDDFAGLKLYTPGVSIRHIAWKHYASAQGLYSKEYVADRAATRWLDWSELEGLGVETRLSTLCYWAQQFHKRGHAYGLRLPDIEIAPDTGTAHYHQILKALALFQWRADQLSQSGAGFGS